MAAYTNEKLTANVVSLNKLVRNVGVKICEVDRRVDDVDVEETRKYLTRITEDAKFIHHAYKALFFRQLILTEVRHLLNDDVDSQNNAVRGLIVAYDFGDDWWLSRKEYPMYKWLDVALAVANLFGPGMTRKQVKDAQAAVGDL